MTEILIEQKKVARQGGRISAAENGAVIVAARWAASAGSIPAYRYARHRYIRIVILLRLLPCVGCRGEGGNGDDSLKPCGIDFSSLNRYNFFIMAFTAA